MSHIPDTSAPEPPRDRAPGRLRRLASRLLPGAAVLLDAVGVNAQLAGHDGFAKCVRAGATALRATALVLADHRSLPRPYPALASRVGALCYASREEW
jgi:hypothetical protein